MGFSRQEHWSGVPLPSPHWEHSLNYWTNKEVPEVVISDVLKLVPRWLQDRRASLPRPGPIRGATPSTGSMAWGMGTAQAAVEAGQCQALLPAHRVAAWASSFHFKHCELGPAAIIPLPPWAGPPTCTMFLGSTWFICIKSLKIFMPFDPASPFLGGSPGEVT